MNGNGNSHPARSVDFLSRLHDGELAAGERARFEAHRAHCSECRRAVIEFEDAISLFRSTRSNPPRTDLATRILRKVQSTNRPRSPFSRRFQIDLGWAALLLTALFAVLITRPILVRQPHVPPPPTAPTAAPAVAAAPEPPRDARDRAVRREKVRSSDQELSRQSEVRDELAAGRSDADAGGVESENQAPEQPPAVLEKSERALEDRSSSSTTSGRAVAAAPAPAASRSAGAGGEGDASGRTAAAPVGLRLAIREADGFGTPPALQSQTRITMPVSARGREYVLLVDAQGTVRSVTPEGPTSEPLSRLRFEPGPRPRRLVVRLD
jgi:Putative zinc-finger